MTGAATETAPASDPAADAELVVVAFARARRAFGELIAAAADHFAARDWQAAQRDAERRLRVYPRGVREALDALRARMGSGVAPPGYWPSLKREYARLAAERDDAEVARTFFNSVVRRLLGTVGVEPGAEFVGEEASAAAASAVDAPVARFELGDDPTAAIAALLGDAPLVKPLVDAPRDAGRVAIAVRAAAGALGGAGPVELEALRPVFYRNKTAFLVARLRRGDAVSPLVVALAHVDDAGPRVDAVLTTSDEVSIVFGFSWSYFQVEVERPAAMVAFLASIMPLKRTDELYTAIGFNRHGKTELYRSLLGHLAESDATFERALGARGLVMTVFTLPSFNTVFKVIRDRFGPSKTVTPLDVMAQYRFVFLHDRAGRLADAQEFEQLELPRRSIPGDLMAELTEAAGSTVREEGDVVVVRHCYTQRRLVPLDEYLRGAEPEAARAAVLDYGRAIRELACAGIFPGDLLLKNFGVSRHGRVIFYDYDELTDLDDCVFREIPQTDDPYEEMSAEPWYSVGPHDVFPEEFLPFLFGAGALRDLFVAAHGDLLTARWWRDIQERVRAGEVFDDSPYPESRRLA